jgi:H+/Cl- antiporter ClcA/CBS domain-containing protein
MLPSHHDRRKNRVLPHLQRAIRTHFFSAQPGEMQFDMAARRREMNSLFLRLTGRSAKAETNEQRLGDFTTTPRVIILSALAIIIGLLGAVVALVLLRLIGLFTNLFFFQRWDTTLVSPAGNQLGILVVLVPVIGALIVGFMARYGSERIRGHGIPEAIEAILINGSKIQPRVAILKPLSSAISIGSGGPFGAEGPIIMTGGAFGSLIAQFLRLTSAERKTLLVAGAAAGMSATFAAPIASTLLAVELLLFEWKPRSLIPVALAAVTADAARYYLIGAGPLFPTPAHVAFIGVGGLMGCVLVGVLAGALSALLTLAVYAAEDAFRLLPIHWMWWPAIGGVVIGLGGLIFPQALGVGYSTINALLQGKVAVGTILGILIVKSIIWSVSLGSGTSGGVLAPLLMMGGALGGILALILPFEGTGFWELIAMAAILGGTMRSPFTGVIFTLELTHDINALLPLLVACVIAHGFTVLMLKRSILTEKVARRGYHLSREYAVDPLEILFVREVAQTNIVALSSDTLVRDLAKRIQDGDRPRGQYLFPITDKDGLLVGVVARSDVQRAAEDKASELAHLRLADIMNSDPVVAYPDEPLRVAVSRMASTGLTRLPVVERDSPRKVLGMVSLHDVLKARAHNLEAEQRRERILPLRIALPRFRPRSQATESESEPDVEVEPGDESTTESTGESEADKTTSQT